MGLSHGERGGISGSSEKAKICYLYIVIDLFFIVTFLIPPHRNKCPPNCIRWTLCWVTRISALLVNSESGGWSAIISKNWARKAVSVTREVQRNSYRGLEVRQVVLNWEQLAVPRGLVFKVSWRICVLWPHGDWWEKVVQRGSLTECLLPGSGYNHSNSLFKRLEQMDLFVMYPTLDLLQFILALLLFAYSKIQFLIYQVCEFWQLQSYVTSTKRMRSYITQPHCHHIHISLMLLLFSEPSPIPSPYQLLICFLVL